MRKCELYRENNYYSPCGVGEGGFTCIAIINFLSKSNDLYRWPPIPFPCWVTKWVAKQ